MAEENEPPRILTLGEVLDDSYQPQPRGPTMRRALAALTVFVCLSAGAVTKDQALAQCDVEVQHYMQVALQKLDQGIPGISVMHEFAFYAIASHLNEAYRDAVLDLIDALERQQDVMPAREKALAACVAGRTEISV